MSDTEKKELYVKVKDPAAEFPEIRLYQDAEAKCRTDGRIEVGKKGAVITFAPVKSDCNFSNFESLVIHPLGKKTARVDLQWKVGRCEIKLKDINRRNRKYSYTLCVQLEDGPKVYLDPQLVNRGR